MNAQEIKRIGYSKAVIALVAALSCIVIYILSCVLSPVTWSPDSSKIALLVTPRGDDPDKYAICTYDIATGEHALLDEVKKDGVLSAPAWSPDGEWIAYYKVEPSPPADPNAPAPSVEPTGAVPEKTGAQKTQEKSKTTPAVEELFTEENRMLPPFLLEVVKEKLSGELKERNTFNVKLITIRPDASERNVLRIMKWLEEQGGRENLMLIRPEWSRDSKYLFYARTLDSFYYIGGLNIATGEAYTHLFSSLGTAAASPDGKWITSLSEAGSKQLLLTLASTDGSVQKYFKLDLHINNDALKPSNAEISWSPDSRYVLTALGGKFCILDTETGRTQKYRDPDTEKIAYGIFSPDRNTFYYLARYGDADPNSDEDKFSLKCVNLEDGEAKTVFEVSRFPDLGEVGKFSVSPDGRMVVLRGMIENETGDEKSVLIFWDGKTQKIVETDRWLMKALYTDEDLIFEKRLIGKWEGKNGETLVCEGTRDKTYKMMETDEDGEKHRCAANLVRLKGVMFLGLFLDESLLQQKDSHGSHLLPDAFMKVEQIEPKLLLRAMDYEEVAEMLKKDPNWLEETVTKGDGVLELTRVLPKDSDAAGDGK